MTGVSAWLFSLTDIGRNTLPVAGGMYRYDRGFRSGRPGRCLFVFNFKPCRFMSVAVTCITSEIEHRLADCRCRCSL